MDPDIEKTQVERKKLEQQLASLSSVTFDTDLYGGDNRFEGYNQSIAVNDEEESLDPLGSEVARKMASYTGPKLSMNDLLRGGDGDDGLGFKRSSRIIDREDEYKRRRLNQVLSPERHDAFAMGDKTPDVSVRTYADVMKEEAHKRKREEVRRAIEKKMKEKEENKAAEKEKKPPAAAIQPKRRNRWDQSKDRNAVKKADVAGSDWDLPDSTPGIGRWDTTPAPGTVGDAAPSFSRRNRWDETPAIMGPAVSFTPGVTPIGGAELATPSPATINLRVPMTPVLYNLLRWERDIEVRNRPLTDEELDAMFPQKGYKILDPPPSYVPIRTPARKLLSTTTPMGTPLYQIPEENRGQQFDVPKEFSGGLPNMKPEDYQYFGALLTQFTPSPRTVKS